MAFADSKLQQKNKIVAVLGGSFDPVHAGHMAVADLVSSSLNVSELRFMPCKIAPHKTGYFTDEQHRVAMLNLAIKNTPYLVDESELSRQTTSYTVQSMRLMREQIDEDACIAFVVGYDSLQNLHTWWQWEKLFDEVHLVVVGRPGYEEKIDARVAQEIKRRQCQREQLHKNQSGNVLMLPSSEKSISSSEIRKEISENVGELSESLTRKLGESVANYIKKHQLYLKKTYL